MQAITNLWRQFEAEQTLLEQAIREHYQSHIPIIRQLSGHLFESGGKRVRPLMLFACAAACGHHCDISKSHAPHEQAPDEIGLAVAIEYLHSASLLHDDVVDASPLRRGQPSANHVWGNRFSILVGDYLFARSFQLMTQYGSLEIMNILAEATQQLAEGQILELGLAHEMTCGKDSYLKMIGAKTAALFSASAKMGVHIACEQQTQSYQEIITGFEKFGFQFGLAFQLIDDVIDYESESSAMGKATGDDFHEGKVTMPVFMLYEESNLEMQQWLSQLFKDPEARTEANFLKLKAHLIESGHLTKTRQLAHSVMEVGYQELEKISLPIINSDIVGQLKAVAEEALSRSN